MLILLLKSIVLKSGLNTFAVHFNFNPLCCFTSHSKINPIFQKQFFENVYIGKRQDNK